MTATWRTRSAPIIARVIAEVGTDDMKALRKALREAYPFRERKYWPYKVWCDEVKRQIQKRLSREVTPPPSPPGPLEILMEDP